MDSVLYVRLDFSSGDFLHPPGVELLRGNREMGKNGKDFAKEYGTLMHEAVYLVILDEYFA